MQIPELLLSRILIVDDNHSNIEILKELLELKGYSNIRTTTKPLEAEGIIDQFNPNLLILDLMMPELSGYELMERLKNKGLLDGYMPILVLTADATYEAKKQALQGGASDFLTKPFDLTEVDLRIKNLLTNVYLMNALKIKNLGLSETVKEKSEELNKSYEQLEIEKIRAEANELKYRTLFDANKDFICLLELQEESHKCPIRELNQASFHVTGYTREELLGQPYMNLEAIPARDQFDLITQQLKADGEASFETVFKRKDGRLCNVEAKAVMVEIAGQKLVLMICRDITERVKFIDEITRQNETLRDIAWSQSHLVRAPLARLMGLVNLLEPSAQELEIIEAIKTSADELDAIIHDIADKTFTVNQSINQDIGTAENAYVSKHFHVLLVEEIKMEQLLQKAVIMRNKFHPNPEFAFDIQEAYTTLQNNNKEESSYLVFVNTDLSDFVLEEFLEQLRKMNLKSQIRIVLMSKSDMLEMDGLMDKYPELIGFIKKPISAELVNKLRTQAWISAFFQS
ncbi:MAG: response regulator [Bacteroidia bacterium]|nr:response regulator [Bacteroidia bacterium]